MKKIVFFKKYLKSLSSGLFLLLCVVYVQAQNPIENITQGADSLKAIEGAFVRKIYVLPIISASPETSLRIGVAGVFLFRKKGLASETQLSSIRVPVSYTLNNQFKAKVNFNYYGDHNKHIFSGNIEWFNFPLLFYGIGNNTKEVDEEIYTTQILNADLTYLKSIAKSIYIGLGYSYFRSEIVKFEDNGLLAQPGLIPGNMGVITSGFDVNIRYDNRDNNLSASRGVYADVKLASSEPWMGSQFNFTRLDLDIRTYFLPFDKHVLALQVLATTIWGSPSFETMALLGGKTIMRGHYVGRFRDNSLYAAQIEYRLPLVRSSWIDDREKVPFKERWGVVGFLGVGDVAPSLGEVDFGKIKSSIGLGIRYLVLPKERINIRIDFGFGTQHPGLYFNVREAF